MAEQVLHLPRADHARFVDQQNHFHVRRDHAFDALQQSVRRPARDASIALHGIGRLASEHRADHIQPIRLKRFTHCGKHITPAGPGRTRPCAPGRRRSPVRASASQTCKAFRDPPLSVELLLKYLPKARGADSAPRTIPCTDLDLACRKDAAFSEGNVQVDSIITTVFRPRSFAI